MSILSSHRAFLANTLSRQSARRSVIDPTFQYTAQPEIRGYSRTPNAEAGPSKRNIPNYIPEEETIRNELTERYIQTGEFGSNYIQGAAEGEICEEYPALRKLMDLKTEHVDSNSHPPLYLPLADTSSGNILTATAGTRFDVILLRPTGTWTETAELPIRNLSADPSFVFLWVGKGDDEGLEKGRECFAKWGFRRAEDIVWVKTNKRSPKADSKEGESGKDNEEVRDGGTGGGGLFASSKEHCLMGIRGTVRRSTDTRFVHCNVDTDILVWEQEDNERFPPYLYTLIENFCLGTRRLELFGNPKSKRGWVSATTSPIIGVGEEPLKFDPTTYSALLPHTEPRPNLPFHPEIDSLRPKSPPRRGRGGHLPHNPHPHPHQPQHQPYTARPPRHQYQQQQNPAQMHQMQMQAQAQAQAQMAMQMQMQHMQMMAAMNMNMGVGMGMPDPMMQGMGMGMDPAMMRMGMSPGQELFQGQDQSWGYIQGNDGMQSPQQGWGGGQMGGDGGGGIQSSQQGWQGNPYDPQSGQYQSSGQGGQWQGGQFYPGQGQWGWQQ